jgi:asparagine synthase (glutamine-hydrolysing)
MTALAAVFAPDGRPEDAEVRRMLAAAAHRGPRAPAIQSFGPATLGHRASALRTGVPPAPCAARPDGSAIVFDGRLDNREDLRGALGASPASTDAALALAAYAKWDEAAPSYLLGDFAFVIWDAGKRRLMCARDVFGQRPLFYASGASTIAVASEPQQLLAHSDVRTVVNEGAIAEYLTVVPMSMEETIWQGVTRLPPAHALIVSTAGVRRFRYWDFDRERTLEYARPEEYAEHFESLFRTAIACRTSGAASVGVLLSGGLDSSAIAGIAQGQARARGDAPVRAFSLTFPGRSATREEIERDLARFKDVPAYPNGSVLDPLRRRAAPEVDVMLTGYGGDDWFTGSPLHTADLLREGRFLRAAQQYRHDIALPGCGYTPGNLFRTAVGPLLPRVARAALRPLLGTRPPSYAWIRPAFAARVGLRERLRPPAPPRCRTLVQSSIHAVANSLQQVSGDESEDRAAAAAGLDQRHPFNDRRLAEFGFALPESQRWAGGETKVVMRRALAPVLPAIVCRRNDKAEFTLTVIDALEMLGGQAFLSRLRVAEAGWVDAGVVRRMYDEMVGLYSRHDEAYIPLADAVWSVAAVELWLQHR